MNFLKSLKFIIFICIFVILTVTFILVNPFGWFKSNNHYTIDPSLDPMELHFFINSPKDAYLPDIEHDFVLQTIQEKFNVDLKVTHLPAGEEFNSRIAAMLAANNPPDMWLGMGADRGAKNALDNVVADMTFYVKPDTMPNYFNYWMTEEELKQYQIHNKFARAPLPYNRTSYRAYYIRKDWLDHLKLEIPQTYDQYVEVLKAFTFQDPNQNGIDDTFGFSTSGNGNEISTDWPEYVKNDLLFPAYYHENELIDMQMDYRVEHVIEDILNVINLGVIDPDWFLNKGSQHVEKAIEGKIGIILGDTATFALDANENSIQTRTKKNDPDANWIPFNPFGTQPLRVDITPNYPFLFSNNTAGRNPEKLKKTVEILDWLAGEEGFLLTHYGLDGVHYTREGNTITLDPEQVKKDVTNHGNFLAIWSFFTPKRPDILGINVLDPLMSERDQNILEFLENIPIHEGIGTILTPPLGVSEEAMRLKQHEYQVKMLFSDQSGEGWLTYRQDIMQNYQGEQIFNHYEIKIKNLQTKKELSESKK